MSLLERAEVLVDLGRAAEALPVVARHLAEHPSDAHALCVLSRAQLGVGDAPAALASAAAAAAAAPDLEWPHRLASLAFSASGQPEQAVRAAQEAVRLDPDLWATQVSLAEALLAADRPAEAWGPASWAASLAWEEPEAHLCVGNVALGRRDLDTAERAYRAALALDPGSASALTNLALVHERRGRPAEASRAYLASSAADPRAGGPAGIATVVWTLAFGLQAVLVLFALVLLARLRPPDPMPTDDLEVNVLIGGALAGGWIVVQLARLPGPVRRVAFRTYRRGWGLLVLLGTATVAAPLVALPFVPQDRRTSLLLLDLPLMAALALATVIGVRTAGRDVTADRSAAADRR